MGKGPRGPFTRALRVPSSANHLLKALPPYTITVGGRISTHEFGEAKNIQTIALNDSSSRRSQEQSDYTDREEKTQLVPLKDFLKAHQGFVNGSHLLDPERDSWTTPRAGSELPSSHLQESTCPPQAGLNGPNCFSPAPGTLGPTSWWEPHFRIMTPPPKASVYPCGSRFRSAQT